MTNAEVIRLEERIKRSSTKGQREDAKVRCAATTSNGRPCRNYAMNGSTYCKQHASVASARRTHPSGAASLPSVSRESDDGGLLARLEDFMRRRLRGDYEVDDFGYDEELAREILLPFAKPLYDNYFRVRTLGLERIPDEGSAILVGNHSGTVALDAVIVQYAVATHHPAKRRIRNVGADLVFQMPFLGPLARKTGNVLANDDDAHELIKRGELVGVYPEGYKGVGKGWRERYKLQRFGRGGFMELALDTNTPIIPVAIVGAEEAFPMIANAKLIAKAFGLPYFPITPTFPLLGPFGLFPLPSKWIIEFGEPISMDEYPDDAAEDPMLVFDLSDRVRDTVQQMIHKLLAMRGGAFI
jgi:1-acyl-sn-glycerol-3-phosphate acyltransferase